MGEKERRGREAGRTGMMAGRTGMMTGPKPREAACASPVKSGSVLGLPTRPKSHQSPVCVSGTSSGPFSAATGALRGLASAGTPRGGIQGKETASPTGTSRCKKKKIRLVTASLCGNNRAPPARERKSWDNDLPTPTS